MHQQDQTRTYISCLNNGDETRVELDRMLNSAKDHMCFARANCAAGILGVA